MPFIKKAIIKLLFFCKIVIFLKFYASFGFVTSTQSRLPEYSSSSGIERGIAEFELPQAG
jgi:hypothetical protein